MITTKGSLPEELKHLTRSLQPYSFNSRGTSKGPSVLGETTQHYERNRPKTKGKAYLLYKHGVIDQISEVLRKKNITSTFLPTAKVGILLRCLKQPVNPFRTPGIYKVPCECEEMYTGQTTRTVITKQREHKRHLRLLRLEKSAMTVHSIVLGNKFLFDKTEVLARSRGYNSQVRQKAIDISNTAVISAGTTVSNLAELDSQSYQTSSAYSDYYLPVQRIRECHHDHQ